jgi:hypothetical protein
VLRTRTIAFFGHPVARGTRNLFFHRLLSTNTDRKRRLLAPGAWRSLRMRSTWTPPLEPGPQRTQPPPIGTPPLVPARRQPSLPRETPTSPSSPRPARNDNTPPFCDTGFDRYGSSPAWTPPPTERQQPQGGGAFMAVNATGVRVDLAKSGREDGGAENGGTVGIPWSVEIDFSGQLAGGIELHVR